MLVTYIYAFSFNADITPLNIFLEECHHVFNIDDQPTNVEYLSPSCYTAICVMNVLCSVTFDWL